MQHLTILLAWLISSLFFLQEPHLTANEAQSTSQAREELLISHVKKSIENAVRGISKLHQNVLKIDGMSSPIIRHFLNNLCSLNDARYLEIGCWKGSTFVAALYKNQTTLADAVAIDNWSEFHGPRTEFHRNLFAFLDSSKLRVFETDCFSLKTVQSFQRPVNIYFYDGNHSEASQKAAFTYFDSILDDVFIAVVDDWNWEAVRNGTVAAFRELQYEILYDQSFFTSLCGDRTSWWNGFYIAVIKKGN